jgi:N-acetylneuraminate synthase
MQPYLIAEIGINHNGDMDLAKQMIDAAVDAGFDAVKFQKRTIDKVYTQAYLAEPRESPWGTTQREQKEGLEFSRDEYQEIDRYCRESGIAWSASAWDLDAQDFLRDFDLQFNKVASAALGHQELLEKIAEEKRRTFISTGMATMDEIDVVVALFRKKDCPFELMHCCSVYPMDDGDANLRCIPMLRERHDCNVGYSGHETTLIKVCVTAVALGATSIERHITLNRAMYGSDQSASIETHALRNFSEAVRSVSGILGDGVKDISERETAVRAKLRLTADVA